MYNDQHPGLCCFKRGKDNRFECEEQCFRYTVCNDEICMHINIQHHYHTIKIRILISATIRPARCETM